MQLKAATLRHGLVLLGLGLAATLVGCATPGAGGQPAGQPIIDLRADEELRKTTDYLQGLNRFKFEVDIAYDDALVEDELVQKHRHLAVAVARPNRVHGTSIADETDVSHWYDGKQLTYLDRRNGVYSIVDMPGTIDTLLDTLADKYVVVPIAEFLSTDAHRWLMGSVTDAAYVSETTLAGEKVHHLAFRQPTLDWQLWISADGAPLPRQLVIRYKAIPGNPQYCATFVRWDTSANLSDADFMAQIPPDAAQVAFEPKQSAVGAGTKPQ